MNPRTQPLSQEGITQSQSTERGDDYFSASIATGPVEANSQDFSFLEFNTQGSEAVDTGAEYDYSEFTDPSSQASSQGGATLTATLTPNASWSTQPSQQQTRVSRIGR